MSEDETLRDLPLIVLVPPEIPPEQMEALSDAAIELCTRPGAPRASTAQILYEELHRGDVRLATEPAHGSDRSTAAAG